jgi:hypothetical protein
MYCIEQTVAPSGTLKEGRANQILTMELLEVMRACLRDLKNVKLFRPDDPDVIRVKEHLREKIAEMEGHGSKKQQSNETTV